MGAAGVAGSTLSVLACQPHTSAQGGGGGGGGPEEKVLNFYNWADYVAKGTVPGFEKETGIKVTQDFYSSNEDLLAKLQAGGTGYDVIVPSDYMVAIMVKSDVVQKLDMAQIHVFSGDAFLALSENPDLDYVVPKPAATRWTDNMCIPNGAEHPQNAHKLINYILGAQAGAELSNYTYYNTPNAAALPKIDGALKNLPGYTLPESVFARLQVIEDPGEATREYERLFTEVKSS